MMSILPEVMAMAMATVMVMVREKIRVVEDSTFFEIYLNLLKSS